MAASGRIDFPQEKINESHHMENAWVFPSISHSMGKCNKTHLRGESGKLVIILSYSMGTFSHLIPILSYTSWVFPSIPHSTGKCNKNPSYGENLGNW